MLTYKFENLSVPLYEYIYQSIKADILSGKLAADEKLPSKRNFANNNGISVITIQNAYDQLISEGYIYTIPKKGYYVSAVNKPQTQDYEGEQSICSDIWIPEQPQNTGIDLSSNRMDPSNFPFSIWAKLLRSTISSQSAELMTPSATGGIFALRQSIADYLLSFRGIHVDPNQIIIGAGTEYLYGLIIQLLGKSKIYCTENPGYKKLISIYGAYDIQPKLASMDNDGICIEDLRKENADIAHLSPTHHFPSGITMPITRRYEVLKWANAKPGRYIIEDDYDSEFRQNGKPIPPLFGIDKNDKVIYINTFSKSLTPTIRISYMILPRPLAQDFYKKLSFYSCTVSTFEQYTLSRFISEGYFEKHINRMRLFYRKKRALVMSVISRSSLADHCRILENDSGLHFLIELNTVFSDRELKQILLEHQIHISALSDYYLDNRQGAQHLFLINYSNIDLQGLEYALETIAKII